MTHNSPNPFPKLPLNDIISGDANKPHSEVAATALFAESGKALGYVVEGKKQWIPRSCIVEFSDNNRPSVHDWLINRYDLLTSDQLADLIGDGIVDDWGSSDE